MKNFQFSLDDFFVIISAVLEFWQARNWKELWNLKKTKS